MNSFFSMIKYLNSYSFSQNQFPIEMRNSKTITPILNTPPPQSSSLLPVSLTPSSDSINKFKILKKTFLLNKTSFRNIIKRQNQTSYSLTRKLNTLIDKQNNISQYSISLKKACDNLTQLSIKKEAETECLRQEAKKIRKGMEYDLKEKKDEQEMLKEVERRKDEARDKEEDSVTELKSLQHMIERLMQDEAFAKGKIKNFEAQLKRVKAEIDILENKRVQLLETYHISNKMSKQIRAIHIQKIHQRKQDKQFYEVSLKQIKQAEKIEKEHTKVTQEIQAMAASDWNDFNIVKWKMLLSAELAARKILKFKIKNLEKKYAKDKDIFHKIKVKTQIEDPKAIKSGFYRMGETAIGLMSDVKALEQREVELNQKRLELKQQLWKQQEQAENLTEANHFSEKNEEHMILQRKVRQSDQKCFQIEMLEKQIDCWCKQGSYKIQGKRAAANPIASESHIEASYPFSHLGDSIIQLCDDLVKKHKRMKMKNKDAAISWEQLRGLENVVYGTMRKNCEE